MMIGLWMLSSLVGCGPNCQDSCNALYQESECNIQRPGRERSELLQLCMDECETALQEPGDAGSYDPWNRTSSSVSVHLENDQMAALWMDCVTDFTSITTDNDGDGERDGCEELEQGYCAPIW